MCRVCVHVQLVDSARSDRFNEAVLRRMHRQRRKGAARPVSTPLFDSVKRLEQRVRRRCGDALRVACHPPTPPCPPMPSLHTPARAPGVAQVSEKLIGKFRRVQDAFRKFDRNGDGHISRSEFRDGLRALGFKVTEDQLSQLVKVLDHDGNGVVDYREFSKHIGTRQRRLGLLPRTLLLRLPCSTDSDTPVRPLPHHHQRRC